MSLTMTDIQTIARFYTRFDGFTITSGTNLAISNQVYRKMQTFHEWPELYRTITTLSVADGTETYDWPLTTVFLKEPLIRVQTEDSKFSVVRNAPSEQLWSELSRQANGLPSHYRRSAENRLLKIAFRPIPDFAGTVEISGYVVARDLNGTNSKTVFENKIADDAFAIWLAAIESDKKGFGQRAGSLFTQAASLLSEVTGRSVGATDLGLNIAP